VAQGGTWIIQSPGPRPCLTSVSETVGMAAIQYSFPAMHGGNMLSVFSSTQSRGMATRTLHEAWVEGEEVRGTEGVESP